MTDPRLVSEVPIVGAWYETCTCGHAWMMHDVETLENDRPSCCHDGCPCGPGSYFPEDTP